MKKIILPLVLIFSLLMSRGQHHVSRELAEHIAVITLNSKAPSEHHSKLLSLEIRDTYTMNRNNQPIFHIVNFKPTGYVIVSASKSYYPVIAYSFFNTFELPIKAPAVQMWLDHEAAKQEYSRTGNPNHTKILSAWKELETASIINIRGNNSRQVMPMLTTQWNQGVFYNEMCPPDPSGPDKKTYAGCVATAIGQVMNYFRYPLSGTGTYTSEYTVYGVHTVDYDNAAYNWNEMPLKLSRSNHPVAELLYHIGVSVDMNYGPNGSGMWNHKAAHTMKTFFGYTDSTQYNFRDTTTIDWNGMLIDHLNRGIVLYYAGWTDSQYVSGHAFVCDGYQDSTFFHFNWGWGGAYDGYFHIDNLIVGGADFTTMHEAVINATPATNYPYYCIGTDTLRSLDGTIDDGSGPLYNYADNSFCSWLIMPFDTVNNITLDFIKFDLLDPNDVIRVYNGSSGSAPLLGTYTGTTLPQSVSSTGKTMYIEFESDGSSNSPGFLLSYRAAQVKTCTGLVSLTASSGTITDGSGTYNYQNSNYCRWRIEPPGAEMIYISFTDFDVDTTDYVRVTDLSTNTIVASLKGSQLPDDIVVWSDKVLVMFLTGPTGNASGFTLNYQSFQQNIPQLLNEQISIYPNPASDILTISYGNAPAPEECLISVYSVTGQNVHSATTSFRSGQTTMNISHLPEGLYFIHVTEQSGYSFYKKFIITR
jgi:hypothetical protein